MFNFLKTTFTDANQADLDMEKFVKESCDYHGKRATAHNVSYVAERQWKSNYILVNVIAEGYDIKRFLEVLVKEKGKHPPNVS